MRSTLVLLLILVAPALAADPAKTVLVPAGAFPMGSETSPDETPVHRAQAGAFRMAVHEVTNGEYEAFVKAGGYAKKDHWSKEGWAWREKGRVTQPRDWEKRRKELGKAFAKHPVVGVSFWEAQAYAKFAGKRLPTEIEWEKAARGTSGRVYPWGNDATAGGPAGTRETQTRPVGTSEKDRTPEGIHDLGGNVAEWTSSFYKPYPGSRHTDRDHGETYRVVRGGSWRFDIPNKRRAAWRGYWRYGDPGSRNAIIGIRLVEDG